MLLSNKKQAINQKKQAINKLLNDKHKANVANVLYNLNHKRINSIIPLKIYQTWHSDEMPNSVKFCTESIKATNPEFEYHCYNKHQCRQYIADNFSAEILETYDNLIPNAFKADLWRYCILYKNGGIYLDIKYYTINNFKFISLTDKEYFCRDIKPSQSGIYNALIICKPGNSLMLQAINQIVVNAKNNFYGDYCLCPTGPLLLKTFVTEQYINALQLSLFEINSEIYIGYNNAPILYFHKEYRKDQSRINKHWSEYWNERNIYLNNNKSHIESFTNVYETNKWGNNNNKYYNGSSGSGSSIHEQINTYVPFLKQFIKNRNINSIVDLGCGDFVIGKYLYENYNGTYTGYDAYKKVVDYNINNNKLTDKFDFIHLDICNQKEAIIASDLCILKDILMHWKLQDIYTFLDYIIASNKFKYILICNDIGQSEDDTNINIGDFRPLTKEFYPLKKYNLNLIYKYLNKEILLIGN